MAFLKVLRFLADYLLGSRRSGAEWHRTAASPATHQSRREIGQPSGDTDTKSGERTVGFPVVAGEEFFESMSPDELLVWENRDIPSLARVSDRPEAQADEKQDVTTSLNFPLHWTSAEQSWDYLFDFSVACELLGPRPDDLVLDFAAGTCWATELLGRLGVRTVAVDLSLEMMRRGRQRLAADSRLVFRDESAFVVARGQALPFAAGSFDGVLCLNALHHLPSYVVALRELHRVLKPGGRAVFSEPGTAHPVQPLSQFRMREESVVEKAVSLPLIRRLAMDAGFTRMRVVPLRSSATYVFEYAATQADGLPLRQMWDETIRLCPGEHARFVLDKGDDPPSDTSPTRAASHGRREDDGSADRSHADSRSVIRAAKSCGKTSGARRCRTMWLPARKSRWRCSSSVCCRRVAMDYGTTWWSRA
jgi:SAM-dependent methyltransferase